MVGKTVLQALKQAHKSSKDKEKAWSAWRKSEVKGTMPHKASLEAKEKISSLAREIAADTSLSLSHSESPGSDSHYVHKPGLKLRISGHERPFYHGSSEDDVIVGDTKTYKNIKKAYGSGHDMSLHGEGKPYGKK